MIAHGKILQAAQAHVAQAGMMTAQVPQARVVLGMTAQALHAHQAGVAQAIQVRRAGTVVQAQVIQVHQAVGIKYDNSNYFKFYFYNVWNFSHRVYLLCVR